MDLGTLTTYLYTAIAGNGSLKTWCNSNYSKYETIYAGIDLQHPPDESEFPIIHIFPLHKLIGDNTEDKDHTIMVVYGLNDSNLTSSTVNGITVKVYNGLTKLHAFRKLIETTILATFKTYNLQFNKCEIDIEAIEFFPFFFAIDTEISS